MNPTVLRNRIALICTVLAVVVPCGLLVLFIVQKHQAAEQYLADMEPRYARMLGLHKQRAELDAALERAKADRAQYVSPVTDDAAQTGNAAQQRIRSLLSSAGLQIISSQVLPAKAEKDVERIPLSVRAEGDMLALQAALAGISGQNPAIFLDDVTVVSQNFSNAKVAAKTPIRLSVLFSFSVLREPA